MKIINLGIVAHVDAGKTTLTEQFLYHAGAIHSLGSVDDGTAQTDSLPVERKRGISVRAASASAEYGGVRLNLIDTPGHVDFAAEVERALSVLDVAVLVISAAEGIQSQTEVLWAALRQTHTPVVVFLNKIDRVGADTERVLEEIREKFRIPFLLFSSVSGEGTRACTSSFRPWESPILGESASEQLAERNDALLERYLSDGGLPPSLLEEAFSQAFREGALLPVLAGSAAQNVGVTELMDFLARYAEPILLPRRDDALSGVVYQITHDKTMGRVAHVRLFRGELHNRDALLLPGSGQPEKITQIRTYNGARLSDSGAAGPGEIAALCGLASARVGDIIGEACGRSGCRLSVPLLRVRGSATGVDHHTLLNAFQELAAEDPQLDVQYNPDEKEIDLSITGMIQLEILSSLLLERYAITAQFSPPTVIYKETPVRIGTGFDAYTMPKPCWAVVKLEVEPLSRGSGFEYEAHVPNDKLFYRYQNHIAEAVPRALKQGLYNWEVTDLRVTLVDGEHHTIHTHPLDFFLCTPIAVMKGLKDCGTMLLEPMQTARFVVPEECSGRLLGDIISMRGEYDSPVIRDGSFTLEALLPVATSMDYPARLASFTSGRGVLSARFSGYRDCPSGEGAQAKRRGVNPLDRDRWILTQRSAMNGTSL